MNPMHDIDKYGFVTGTLWFTAKAVSTVAIVYGGLTLATDSLAEKYGIDKAEITNKAEAVDKYNGVKSPENASKSVQSEQKIVKKNVAGHEVSVNPKQKQDMIVFLDETPAGRVNSHYSFSSNFYNNTIVNWNLRRRNNAEDYLYQYRPDNIYLQKANGRRVEIPLEYYDHYISQREANTSRYVEAELNIKRQRKVGNAYIDAEVQNIEDDQKRSSRSEDEIRRAFNRVFKSHIERLEAN